MPKEHTSCAASCSGVAGSSQGWSAHKQCNILSNSLPFLCLPQKLWAVQQAMQMHMAHPPAQDTLPQ